MTLQQLEMAFTYHAPDAEQTNALVAVRQAGKQLAEIIVALTPKCADQSAALRKVREAVMTANAAIVLKGAV